VIEGAGQAGTNEAEFVAILGQRSYPHINSVSDEYAKKYTYSLEDVVKSEFTGDIQKGLLDTRNTLIAFNNFIPFWILVIL